MRIRWSHLFAVLLCVVAVPQTRVWALAPPSGDGGATAPIPILNPQILSFAVHNGAETTTSRTVSLDSTCTNAPTEYRVSEDSTFAGAVWRPYDTEARYRLSESNGTRAHTVYFQVRNDFGPSASVSDSINLTFLVGFNINDGAEAASGFTVTLDHTCNGTPVDYRVSDQPDFSGATWLPYDTLPTYTFFRPTQAATLYFQVRGTGGESDVLQDTISIVPVPATGSVRVTVLPEATAEASATWTIDGTGPIHEGSTTVDGVAAGLHRLDFSINGSYPPYPPASQIVFVRPGETVDATATYVNTDQAANFVVQVKSLEASPGEVVFVPIRFLGTRSGATGMSGDVSWDPNVLKLVGAQRGPSPTFYQGSATTSSFGLNLVSSGRMPYIWLLQPPDNNLPAGEVLWLSFRVADTCPTPSSCAITGTVDAMRFDGGNIDTIPSLFDQATVSVQSYESRLGHVHGVIDPAGAVGAGAQWRIGGGAWNNSGDTVDILNGSYSVEFKSTAGWILPATQSVTVTAGETIEVTGTYTPSTGSISVSLLPSAAVTQGALWRVDGGSWTNSGGTVNGLAPGTHTVTFADVTGWTTPTSIDLSVVVGETTSTSATYADAIPPTLQLSGPSTTLTRTGPITYTIEYSGADAITLADANVQVVSGGSAAGVASVSETGLTTRTVTIGSITGDGTLGIAIAAGTASDSAGNLAAAAGPSATFEVDNTAPTFSSLLASPGLAREGTIVTLTFGSSGALSANPAVTVNGHAATKQSGADYTYQYTVQSSDPDGAATIVVGGIDAAGNTGGIENTTALVVDKTPPNPPQAAGPALTSHRRPTWNWTAGGGGNGTYWLKLDDANLTVDAVETTSTSYTAEIDVTEGFHTLYVLELDSAGNQSSTVAFSMEVDATLPELTLLGEAVMTTEFGIPYTDAGATATDNRDGNLTAAIQTAGLPVDTMHMGQVIIRYNVHDVAGNAAEEKTRSVTVVDTTAPKAVIATNPDPAAGVAPLSLSLDGSGSSDSAGVAKYEWDFDASDGFQVEATGATTQHVFLDGGHTVTLRVTDVNDLFAEATVYVVVNRPPVITALDATPRSGIAPLLVAFQTNAADPDGGQVAYSWDFNSDGIPDSTLQNPTYTYPVGTLPGTYVVSLRVTDPEGIAATAFLPLTITEHSPFVDEVATPEEGCSMTTPDGITIDVPTGAVSQDTVIAASPVDGPSFSVEDKTVFFRLEMGPAGATFGEPVRITIPLPAQLRTAQGLTVRYYNEALEEWSSEGISNIQVVMTDSGPMLQFETTHFSEFGIVGPLGNDINLDGKVNAMDVQLVINAALGKDLGVLNANVDGVGRVAATDVQRVINGALGKN